MARIGIDIGGTFTDAVLLDGERCLSTKLLTRHDALAQAVVEAVRELLARAEVPAGAVEQVVHGTTLATNAIIERRGARTAMITTEGFRDVIELGTESRFDQYDLEIEKPPPLVPRRHRFTIAERMSARGEVLRPLDLEALDALLPMLDEAGIESVAVCLLHAYAWPDHERRIADRLRARRPDLRISLSSEVSPEIREYERFSTTCANAYVQPRVAGYLEVLERRLRELGLRAPLHLMLSNGGLTDVGTAIRFPVRLVESGPAGGAIFAARVARDCGIDGAIAFDMGGTTAKLCLLDRGEARTSRNFEVARAYRFKQGSGLPLRIPATELIEIGAGGGSIAALDALGLIAVGPESAGSDPGPACYGLGGEAPTVTDADLVLGRLDAQGFAGGKISLDREAARAAIGERIAVPAALDADAAAYGIVEMVDEAMANAAREHVAEAGAALGERALIVFGGAGPLHATRVARKLGIRRVVVPAGAGVGSAIGMLLAPVAFEVTQSRGERLSALNLEATIATLREMAGEAARAVASAGEAEVQTRYIAYMRYVGQAHEIVVPFARAELGPGLGHALRTAYDAAYQMRYGRTIPNVDIEVTAWSARVAAAGHGEAPVMVPAETVSSARELRSLYDPDLDDWQEVPVIERAALTPGARLAGPAIIREAQTSTIVPAAAEVEMHKRGHLLVTLGAGA